MVDVFREARELVPAQEAARYYGAEFDRKGWALCPFHGDNHPSMSFKDGRFKCWVCDVSGDSVDYVSRLLGLAPIEAVHRLNEDFRLALPLDRQPTQEERREAAHRRDVNDTYQKFKVWRSELIDKLTLCFRVAHFAKQLIETSEDIDQLTEGQAFAIQRQEILEYWADCLTTGTLDEQMEIFRDRKGVERVCERILRDMPMR